MNNHISNPRIIRPAAGLLRRQRMRATAEQAERAVPLIHIRDFCNDQPHFLQVTECSFGLWRNILLGAHRIECGAGSVSWRVGLFRMHLSNCRRGPTTCSSMTIHWQRSLSYGSMNISHDPTAYLAPRPIQAICIRSAPICKTASVNSCKVYFVCKSEVSASA